MRTVVVADVHANLEAFEAVLEDAKARGKIDAIWSLGDLVGYGPDPEPCVELLQSFTYEAIVGNHDLAAVGVIGIEDFNPYAAAAATWTSANLSAVAKVWMMSLPQILVHESGFTLTHGSLVDPVWEYLVLSDNAAEHLARQSTPYGLVGHTHIPHVFYDARLDAMSTDIADGAELALDELALRRKPGQRWPTERRRPPRGIRNCGYGRCASSPFIAWPTTSRRRRRRCAPPVYRSFSRTA